MSRSRSSPPVKSSLLRRNAIAYSQNRFASNEELKQSGQTANILSEELPKSIKTTNAAFVYASLL